jgi:hypothetical protein
MDKGEANITKISEKLSYELGIDNKIVVDMFKEKSYHIVTPDKDNPQILLEYGQEELRDLDVGQEVNKVIGKKDV